MQSGIEEKMKYIARDFYIHVMTDGDINPVKTYSRMLDVQPSVVLHVLGQKSCDIFIFADLWRHVYFFDIISVM